MSEQSERFDEWAVIELMGHQRIAGRLTEQTIGGQAFLRIDVPEVQDTVVGGQTLTIPPFTRFIGAGAVYAINPTTEQIARAVAARIGVEPISRYELPKLALPAPGPADEDRPCGTCGEPLDQCDCGMEV